MKTEKGLRPIKSPDKNRTGYPYWMCPKCGTWVGGFVFTGMPYNYMPYHEDKYCNRCDTKINWK
jgi:hypothetical protein